MRCLPKQRILEQQWVSRAASGLPWQQADSGGEAGLELNSWGGQERG